MRRSERILTAAWLTLCLAVITAGMALRLSPVEQQVLPPPFMGQMLAPLAASFAAMTVLLLWIGGSHARALNLQRPLAEMILFFPLLFSYLWLLLPARGLGTRDWIVLGIFAAAAVWLLTGSRLRRPEYGGPWRRWLLWDASMILLPVGLGLAFGIAPDFDSAGVGFLFYPAYALVQLTVFLVIPAGRLQRFGLKPVPVAVVCAVVFALIHTPNPVLVPVTFTAMFIWAMQFLAGRRLWQLAVVMGLSATAFTQFLSDDVTAHMRVGPGYLQEKAVSHLVQDDLDTSDRQPRRYLELVYPEILDRKPSAQELETWTRDLDRARRPAMAWRFFASEEYARKAARHNWPAPPQDAEHWLDLGPRWRERISAFGADAYWARCGESYPGFLEGLYRDILRRQASRAEITGWQQGLTTGQRKRIVTLLLENRLPWLNSPYPGLTDPELRLPW